MTVSEYIFHLQSIEEYSFSWVELQHFCNKTKTSLKRELSRLVAKNKLINIRREFYLIIPPRYSKQRQIPIQLYVNKLFKTLKREYYLGLYSAAKFHGASHQQTHQEYIIIDYPKIGDIERNEIKLRFFTTTNWPQGNIIEKKSDAGIFNISSPALTAVNLIQYQNKIGGINRMLAVLEELIEEITIKDISELLQWYSHKSTLQRFGFILEELGAEIEIISEILEHLNSSKYFPTLLVPRSNQKVGKVNNKWKIEVNTKLENDL